ncbi:hypothetical protein BGW80DRAFT_1252232 [Lactifluus volemus]|nr:hypothetical protein BGW80DRAFT_1252232 [Lactifluus volemus]
MISQSCAPGRNPVRGLVRGCHRLHGVSTVVFDLYLLVSDIDAAAEVLLHRGWTYAKEKSADYHFLPRHPDFRRCRLNPPGTDDTPKPTSLLRRIDPPRSTAIVLLPASDWKLPSDKFLLSRTQGFIPSLPDSTDGLIESLLDAPGYRGLEDHLSVHLAYLYSHVPAVKERSFASELMHENRQYHHDVISGLETGTRRFLTNERQVREELRNGTRELQECSVARVPENDQFFFGYLPPALRKSN